MLLTYRVVKAG